MSLERKSDKPAEVKVFAASWSEVCDQIGGRTHKEKAEKINVSVSLWHRYRAGELLPPERQLDRVAKIVEKDTGRPMAAEKLTELHECYGRALETKHPLQRLEAVKQQLTELVRRAEAAEARVVPLRRENARLLQELTSLRSSGSAGLDPDAPGSLGGADQKRQKREVELLRQLAQATRELEEALEEQQQSSKELRDCAEKLIDAVKNYTLYVAEGGK